MTANNRPGGINNRPVIINKRPAVINSRPSVVSNRPASVINLWTLVTSKTCLRAFQSDYGIHDAGGGVCDSWTDQKNSTTATQAGGTARPSIIANASGSHPCLRFDGSNDVLVEATFDAPAPGTTPTFFWGVARIITWTAGKAMFGTGTTTNSMLLGNGLESTPNWHGFNGTGGPSNGGATVGSIFRFELSFTNSVSDYLKLGATSVAGTNLGNVDSAATLNIGGDGPATFANMDWFCLFAYNGAPSGAELTALSAGATSMYPGILV